MIDVTCAVIRNEEDDDTYCSERRGEPIILSNGNFPEES